MWGMMPKSAAENGGWKPESSEIWPRGDKLKHSPLFYAENKDRFLRQLLIRDVQLLTGRPLVVYFASPFLSSSIRNEDVRRLYEVVRPFEGMEIDLMIETGGGETDATEGLVSMMQKVVKSFRAIVPLRAKSNGTLLCLAAEKILMGPTSELGPIEPSVGYIPASILTSSEYRNIDFALHQKALYAHKQTRALAEKLLQTGAMRGRTRKEIKATIDALCTRNSYPSHGSVINLDEAKILHLNIETINGIDDVWRKIFFLHSFYSYDSELRDISKYFEQETISHSVTGNDPPE